MAHSDYGSHQTSVKPLHPSRSRSFSLSSATPGSTSRPTRDGHTYRSPSRQRDIVLSSHRHLSRRTRTRTLSAQDRQRVGKGTSVDLGGGRIIKKKRRDQTERGTLT